MKKEIVQKKWYDFFFFFNGIQVIKWDTFYVDFTDGCLGSAAGAEQQSQALHCAGPHSART